jgi:hypothetical protein
MFMNHNFNEYDGQVGIQPLWCWWSEVLLFLLLLVVVAETRQAQVGSRSFTTVGACPATI